jgi:hypothetical protein
MSIDGGVYKLLLLRVYHRTPGYAGDGEREYHLRLEPIGGGESIEIKACCELATTKFDSVTGAPVTGFIIP